ncbi:MAG TPA: ATP-binding protein, partial [Candidatus Omnitrophota bacterium]|nr:ATP-binding protein [Candidatus Omnitrophota bacterium]
LYIGTLYGTQGLFAASKNATVEQWNAYILKENLRGRYPGIADLQYIERVPEGERDRYVIKFVEPRSGNEKLVGSDLSVDEQMLEALDKAAALARPAATGIHTMSQNGRGRTGFSVYLPVYKPSARLFSQEERRAGVEGYVSVVFRTKALFVDIFKSEVLDPLINFEIYDDGLVMPSRLLYRHLPLASNEYTQAQFQAARTLRIAGRFWVIRFHALPGFGEGDIKHSLPLYVLLAGICFSFLIFGILLSLNVSRMLRQTNEELEKDIEKREHIERELERARDAAEEASHAKSRFLAGMSHELRTPLNAIIGFSEVLKTENFGKLNEKQKEYVGDVWESGKHLLSLINDILDLSKVEAGKMELELGDVDLKSLLRNSLAVIKEKAWDNQITVTVKIEEGLGMIRADERRVKQIIFNLLSNAIKFTPRGGQVGLEARYDKTGSVLVSVWDNGIGIEARHAHKVFAEFEQIGSEYSRRGGGTGLGMPLSKRFVELHGGQMWFESAGKGKGTRFSFTLPVRAGKEEAVIAESQPNREGRKT